MAGSSKDLRVRREAELAKIWVPPTPADISAHADMYEIVYKEATRALDDQAADVANARTRAVQYLAFVGGATSFLAGAAIRDIDLIQRTPLFYFLASTGSILAFAALVCIALLLNPWQAKMYKRVEPRSLMVLYIEREVPLPNKAEMWRKLSLSFQDWQEQNESKLLRTRILYATSVVLGGLQLIAWASLVWVAG